MYNATVKTTFLDFGVIAVFFYDAGGQPIGIAYRSFSYDVEKWENYWYEKNLQGDIVAIYNNSGTKLVTYTYDAWGNYNLTYYNGGASHVPVVNNPIRYRGYYYDIDLGFYYLQTRYYDAKLCRFINADEITNLGIDQNMFSYNLYAYCSNNPVNYDDPSGESWLLAAIVGAVVNVTISYIAKKITGQEYTLGDAAESAVIGLVNAMPVVGPILSGTLSGISEGVSTKENGGTMEEAILTGTISGITTTLSIANLSKLGTSMIEIVTSALADLTFGTGYASLSAAVSKAVNRNVKTRVDSSER